VVAVDLDGADPDGFGDRTGLLHPVDGARKVAFGDTACAVLQGPQRTHQGTDDQGGEHEDREQQSRHERQVHQSAAHGAVPQLLGGLGDAGGDFLLDRLEAFQCGVGATLVVVEAGLTSTSMAASSWTSRGAGVVSRSALSISFWGRAGVESIGSEMAPVSVLLDRAWAMSAVS